MSQPYPSHGSGRLARQKELDSEISKTKEMVQTVRNDNLKAFEEIRRLRSMEQHKHMLQAYPAPIGKDVLEVEPWLIGALRMGVYVS